MNKLKKIQAYLILFFFFQLETLTNKKWQFGITIGLILFCSVFLNIFMPFNINLWIKELSFFPNSMKDIYYWGGITLMLSHSLFIFTIKKETKIYIYHLFLACFIDIICLSFTLSNLYRSHPNNYWYDLYETSLLITPILILAYILLGLLLTVWKLTSNRQEARNNTVIKHPNNEFSKMINIYDANKEIRLILRQNDLLYIEATDNYITVFFLKNGYAAKEIIRNTLKNTAKDLSTTGLIKCHRSYLVNQYAIKGWKKDGRKYKLLLKNTDLSVPISRSYIPNISKVVSSIPKTPISPQEI